MSNENIKEENKINEEKIINNDVKKEVNKEVNKEAKKEEKKMTFENLNLKLEIVEALKEDGIVNPTTIQQQTIPLLCQRRDLVGISRTGSGKTASFGIPILQNIDNQGRVQSLILAPTRELADQISKEMRKWGKYLKIKVATIFGGVGIDPQTKIIQSAQIVVGTPGRIIDHLQRGTLDLKHLTSFVLDEADKMVEMGFIEDIERVLNAAPKSRQIVLFGATISDEIDYLKTKYMTNPIVSEAELHVKKDLLEQYYYNTKSQEKFSLLAHILSQKETVRAMIFCSKRSTVEVIQHNLRNHKFKCEMIHGKMTQNKRLSVIERFNKGKVDILVASAVAARGLHIDDVTHVINYDLPQDPQEYIHRVGRTARAGQKGIAITLLAPQDHGNFHSIIRKYDVEVDEKQPGKFEILQFKMLQNDRSNSYRGSRDSNQSGYRSNNGGFGGNRRPSYGDKSGSSSGYKGSSSGSSNRSSYGNRDSGSSSHKPKRGYSMSKFSS